MAAKSRVARLESEIDKYRGDSNWGKVLDLARQLTTKSSQAETLARFVHAETKLERYLLEALPNEKNEAKAQQQLIPIQREFVEVLGMEPRRALKEDCILLLAKINYAMGDYKGALSRFEEIGLDTLTTNNISNRKLKIIGESFAIKGLSLEKTPMTSTSKYKIAEREDQIITCFEKSGDISILQLQERVERGSKTPTSVALSGGGQWNLLDADTTGVGPLVETAIQQSPILYIRNGELSRGIGKFRELLRAIETRAIQGLRQTLARQLAEVLLRGVCEHTYAGLGTTSPPPSPTSSKPKKFAGENLFCPADENEETLLLLLISESIASREAVLTRSPDADSVRQHSIQNISAVYDLLTLALVKREQFNMLTEIFERAMKFSFDEFHVWYQFALSLICSEKYKRALLVLKECHRLQPTRVPVLLQAARLCFEHLHQVDKGIEYATLAVELGDRRLASRCYLALGIGYSLKAEEARLQVARQEAQRKALTIFIRAASLDTNDHLALFHIALELAHLRQIPEAMKQIRKALSLRGGHLHSLHLLALLLSAQKQQQEALVLIEAALLEYPDNFNLMFTKCKLQEVVFGAEEALQTCLQMLQLWKKLFEKTLANEHRGTGLIDRITTADHRSLIQLQLSEMSDRESGSIRAESLAASRVEHTLSEVASSLGSSVPARQGPQRTWTLQTQIWLLLAELYLSVENLETAHACMQEAGNIFPINHMVSYMRGRLQEDKGELQLAKHCFENAIAINPAHVKSLQHLGMVLHRMGKNRLAEKVLRDAVNVDPASSHTWDVLGRVLEALQEYDAASECLMTAVELEGSSPVVPFTAIPRLLQ